MATGGHFTVETEYFCRYYILLYSVGTKCLRKLIIVQLHSGQTLDAFLQSQSVVTIINTLKVRNIIQQYQYDILYPPDGSSSDLNKWDISLLCTIIKNTCSVSKSVKTNIDKLRKERNQMCHGVCTSMNLADYTTKEQTARIYIMTIVRQCNDAAYERKLVDEMDKIKTQALEIKPTVDMFHESVKRESELLKSVNNIIEQMNEMACSVGNVYDVVKDIQEKTFQADKDTTTSKAEDSSKPDESHYYNSSCFPPVLYTPGGQYQNTEVVYTGTEFYKQLSFDKKGNVFRQQVEIKTRQLKQLLEQESRFVHTGQFIRVEEMLNCTGNVIISGRPGEGKTSTAYELMRKYGESSRCIEINAPDDIIFLEPNMFDFVFIDDLFGQHDVDESKVKSWVPVLEKLQNLLKSKAFRLIISSREIVLKECKGHIIQFDMFSNKVLISSEDLSDEEKLNILQESLNKKARSLTADEMLKCIDNCRSDVGFPYLCFLFASNEEFFQEKVAFFQRSLVVADNLLLQLEPFKLLALWYMWVKGYACRKDELFNVSNENTKLLQSISQLDDNSSAKNISCLLNDIKKKLEIMKDIFIVESNEEYKFLHNSIYQLIGLHFAHRCFTKTVIMVSTLDFFMECFRIKSNDMNSVIFLTEELYQTFVERIIIEVMEKGHCREIVQHPCITEPVLNVLIKTLSARKILEKFLCSGIKTEMSSAENKTFLEGILETAVKESDNFLKKVIAKVKCFHLKKTTCKKCSMFYKAYRGACKGGNMLALLKLKFVEIDDKLLVSAVESRSKIVLQTVVNGLGSNVINPSEMQKALSKSIELRSWEMFMYIQNKLGGIVDIDCLNEAVKIKHMETVGHIANKLYNSGHVCTERQRRHLFDDVDSFDVYQNLSKYNILPTKENIATYISQNRHQLLKDIVYDLELRPGELLKAIKATPNLNDYFISNGVFNPSEYVTDAILKNDLERVKRVLECHNSIGMCDPSKNWVSRSILYLLQHHSVFHFYISMLHNGFIPNDVILYGAVQTNSLEIVQETISKMKTNGNFDCKNTKIKRALLVSVHSIEIYNLLITEGVKPSYYHVLFVAECGKDNADAVAKNVFSLLKASDIKPHNKDLMRIALLASLGQQNLYQCIRTEGGIQLPPYALSATVKRGSVQDLRFVIQEMKLQSVWPSAETDIMNALACCFYIPDLFQELMTSYDIQHVTAFTILAAVRQKNLENLKQSIEILKTNNCLDVNDVIMKLSALEATGNNEIHNFLEGEGLCYAGIFEESVKSKNAQFTRHVMLMLQSNNIVEEIGSNPYSLRLAFETPIILEMILESSDLCTSKLLLIATENRHLDVVQMIMYYLKERNMFKPDDANLIQAVVASVNYTDMFKYLL